VHQLVVFTYDTIQEARWKDPDLHEIPQTQSQDDSEAVVLYPYLMRYWLKWGSIRWSKNWT